MNALIDQVEQRQSVRDHYNFETLLFDGWERIYCTLDAIECYELTLGRIVILLNDTERFMQSLETIKQTLEAEENTQDILKAGNHE